MYVALSLDNFQYKLIRSSISFPPIHYSFKQKLDLMINEK